MESDIIVAVEAFRRAGFGVDRWETALDALARATGSRGGQLIGLGPSYTVPFNLVTETPPEAIERFAQIDGGNPDINSRVRVGAMAKELAVLDERHFDTAGDRRRHPDYGQFIDDFDVPYLCLTPLVKERRGLIGLSVARTRAQGNVSDAERAMFAAIAPHAAQAVRTQMAFEAYGAKLLCGTLDAISLTAFVCNPEGVVLGMTASAEAAARAGRVITVSKGRLVAVNRREAHVLSAALRSAGGMTLRDPINPIALHDRDGGAAVLATVTAAPAHSSPIAAQLIVVTLRDPAALNAERLMSALRVQFGLTPGEARVGADLASGRTTAAIADSLGVSVNTVRSQVRACLAKSQIHSMAAFAAAANRLL